MIAEAWELGLEIGETVELASQCQKDLEVGLQELQGRLPLKKHRLSWSVGEKRKVMSQSGRDFEFVMFSQQQTGWMGRFRRSMGLLPAQYHSKNPRKIASQMDLEEAFGMHSQAVGEQEETLIGCWLVESQTQRVSGFERAEKRVVQAIRTRAERHSSQRQVQKPDYRHLKQKGSHLGQERCPLAMQPYAGEGKIDRPFPSSLPLEYSCLG